MRKISLIMSFLLLSCVVFAQKIDRSKAPKAGKAVVPMLPKTATFTLDNGLKVYVVQNTKVPRVAFSLVLDRSSILEGDKTGTIDMAGQMMLYGTKKYTKTQLDNEIDFVGATLSTSSTGLYAECLKKNTDILLALASDVVLNPTFPEAELEKLKKQAISGLKSSQDDANAISSNIVSAMNYGKMHPYGEITTEKTIQNITVNDCKAYYNNFFRPNIGYMAIVGDITEQEAKTLMNKYFSAWKKQEIPKAQAYKMPTAPTATQVAIVEKTGAVQTVLSVTYPIDFKITSPDYLKAVVLNQILGGSGARLYLNLREDKGFTYGAYSSLSQNKEIGSFTANASVRTAVTDSSVTEFLKEMRRIRDEKVTEKELIRIKASLAGDFARSMESPNTIANYAINIARYGLPEDYYKTYLTRLEAITINDIQEVAKKYILPENANIVAVGDTKILKTKLAKFGKLTQYDMYGNVDAGVSNDMKDLLKDMTAEKVLAKYITAIGGEKKIREVKTIRRTISFEVQAGMMMEMVVAKKSPNKFFTTQTITGMGEMGKTIYDGTKAIMNGSMGKKNLEGKELEKVKTDAKSMFKEIDAKANFTKITLGEVKMIEDKATFEVIFTNAAGENESSFYDTKTGLLVKVITPQIEQLFLEYTEVSGIKVPSKGVLKAQGQVLDATIKTEINPVLEDSLFKTE